MPPAGVEVPKDLCRVLAIASLGSERGPSLALARVWTKVDIARRDGGDRCATSRAKPQACAGYASGNVYSILVAAFKTGSGVTAR